MQLSEVRARSAARAAAAHGLNVARRLQSLDNTAKHSTGREKAIARSPQSAAYHGVVDKDKDATLYARKAAREMVKLFRSQGDRQPPRKLIEGMLLEAYRIKPDKLKHATDIVYATINKQDKREEEAQYA